MNYTMMLNFLSWNSYCTTIQILEKTLGTMIFTWSLWTCADFAFIISQTCSSKMSLLASLDHQKARPRKNPPAKLPAKNMFCCANLRNWKYSNSYVRGYFHNPGTWTHRKRLKDSTISNVTSRFVVWLKFNWCEFIN